MWLESTAAAEQPGGSCLLAVQVEYLIFLSVIRNNAAPFGWLTTGRASALLVGLTGLAMATLFAAHAWVSEDAHITIRTIDNFVNGFGLRWNTDERVQTYTHPLWMMFVTPFYFATREIYVTLTTLSLVLSTAAYLIVAHHFRDRPILLLTLVFAPWAFSTSLVRYATSGFENPLTIFLLALFCVIVLRHREEAVPWGTLALLMALGAVNRLDTILLYAPAFVLLLATHRRKLAWRRLGLGLAPLVAWLLFSLIYYGFVFPNTFYAKQSGAIPRAYYLELGSLYLADLFSVDPVSGTLLALGLLGTAWQLWRCVFHPEDLISRRLASLGVGVVLYSAYVIWIGGDFLSGRFWTAPVLVCLVLNASWIRSSSIRQRLVLVCIAAAIFTLTRVVAADIEEAVPSWVEPLSHAHAHLTKDLQWKMTPSVEEFRRLGVEAHDRARRDRPTVQVMSVVGFAGLAAGPYVRIIDNFALGDPLMARLRPPFNRYLLVIGHVFRQVPRGYKRARLTGSLDGMDSSLAEYYGKLRLIVSGPLLSWERIQTIVRFNLGYYDALLREFEARSLERPQVPDHSP